MAAQPEERELKKQQLKGRIVRDPLPEDIAEEEARIRLRRLRRIGIVLILLAIAAGAFVIVRYIDKNRLCSTYEIVWQEPFDAARGELVNFEEGTLRVTKNGIKYMDREGVVLWDQGANMTNPRLTVREHYALVADLGGRSAYLIKKSGAALMSTDSDIIGADLSDYGVTALMVSEGSYSKVFFYDNVCRQLDIEVKNAIDDENGVPIAMAFAPDGQGMVFSMVNVTGGTTDTWLTFLDLDAENTGTDKVVGAFKYPEMLFPEMEYLSQKEVVAFGDMGMEFFSLSDPSSPKLAGSVSHERKVQSVFAALGQACVIYENEDGNDELVFFDGDGDRGLSYELDFEYSEITCGGGYLLIYNEERCLIVGESGQLVYNGSFSGNTYQMVVTGLHTLLQIGDYGMREVKLK
ncbi:MAG: hypothetical protein J5865_09220 [Lachnospiraceae bacterium]|nr:hypothetical protein [Lachnospiraceae bacterium]